MDYTDLLEFLKLAAYLLPIFLIFFVPIVIFQSFRVIRFYRDPELRRKYKLTGEIGPTPSLRNFLEENGIKISINE